MDYGKRNYQRKRQAKKRGIEYTLTPLCLMKLANQVRCYYLNMPLNVINKRISRHTKFTIDRKNPLKGYTKDNVVAASDIANQLKSLIEFGLITADDIIEFGKKLKELKLTSEDLN